MMVTACFTAYLTCWFARMINFLHDLEVSAISLYLDLFDGFLQTLHDWMMWRLFGEDRSMFLKLDFH